MNSGLLAAQCAMTAVKFWRQRVNDTSAAATAQFQTVLNCLHLLVFMATHMALILFLWQLLICNFV